MIYQSGIETASDFTATPVDLFMCCASFEERSLAIPLKLNPSKIRHALVFREKEHEKFSQENIDKLNHHLSSCSSLDTVTVDGTDPIELATSVFSAIQKKRDCKRILLDITTFTRETLLVTLKSLSALGFSSAEVAYNDAQSMNDKWLSASMREVRPIIGFTGEQDPLKPSHLIMMIGFEVQRAKEIIEAHEPALLTIGHSLKEESISATLYNRNIQFFEELKAVFDLEIRTFSFSARDPTKTMESLEEQVRSTSEYNHVIAPMNTKLSTLGAALLGLRDPKIQITYARMRTYNYERYSVSGSSLYKTTLDLRFSHSNHIR